MEKRYAKIRLFGQFRNYFKQSEIDILVEPHDSLATLKLKIAHTPLEGVTFEDLISLLNSSVFATESQVLTPGDTLPADLRLAILPPVCGG